MDPIELEEEFERKREQYRSRLQPLYGLCIRNEVGVLFSLYMSVFAIPCNILKNFVVYVQVRLVLKVAAGFCPARVAMDESQNLNTRWIVLDRYVTHSGHPES